MYTFGQLKSTLRQYIFPAGEPENLAVAHDKLFVDALMDLQMTVPCLQRDNTDLIPQCATLYNCGLTVFDAPRGNILSLSVIDKINPDTGLEDATADDDYCSRIYYRQVNPCYIKGYLESCQKCNCCLPATFYFCLPESGCNKSCFPVPTDEGVPSGLPYLPLGYHYPQSSTDRTWGRSPYGVWAIESGKIYVAPWIQSTETIIIEWEGIKRTWSDADGVDPDPLLLEAIEEYVRWKAAGKFEKDFEEAARAQTAYMSARQMLWRNCNEETRVRDCQPKKARGSYMGTDSTNSGTLYYNEFQSVTKSCPDGQTGSPVTVTIPAGIISSTISIADANQKAINQATAQANAQLDCADVVVTYWNRPQTAQAVCTGAAGAPAPEGSPATVTIPANTVSSHVSQVAADEAAYALALQQAQAALVCTYKNRERTAYCPFDAGISSTVAAGAYTSTISQDDADAKALTAAQNAVNADPNCLGLNVVWNTVRNLQAQALCSSGIPPIGGSPGSPPQYTYVFVTVPANTISAATQAEANQLADAAGQNLANRLAVVWGAAHQCGSYNVTYPG